MNKDQSNSWTISVYIQKSYLNWTHLETQLLSVFPYLHLELLLGNILGYFNCVQLCPLLMQTDSVYGSFE